MIGTLPSLISHNREVLPPQIPTEINCYPWQQVRGSRRTRCNRTEYGQNVARKFGLSLAQTAGYSWKQCRAKRLLTRRE